MERCKTCSYTPRTEPKVFCPACGAYWPKEQPKLPLEPDGTTLVIGKDGEKPEARDTPEVLIIDDLPKPKPKPKKKATKKGGKK